MTKNSVRMIVVASVVLGCAALFLSQASANENRLVPKNIPCFQSTVNIQFQNHVSLESFSFQASITKPAFYVVVFADSDLIIHEVNIIAPDSNVVTLNSDFSFHATSDGLYVFSVKGYYSLTNREFSSNANPFGTTQNGGARWVNHPFVGGVTGDQTPQIDETTKVSIFEAVEKTVLVHPYSYLLYPGLGLLAPGIVLCFSTWKPRLTGLHR